MNFCNSEKPMVNIFNEIIVSEASPEYQLFFIENMTPEVSLIISLRILRPFSVHSQK